MPGDRQARANKLIARGRRATALARNEFREPSDQRVAPQGPMSFPIKVEDPTLRKLIDDAIAKRSQP